MQQSLGHGLAESAGGTPIVSLPGPRVTIPWVTQYRSTWIVSGLDGLRYAGYLDRYTELLGPHRDQLLTCVAGIWLPIDVAFTHYDACERLRIPDHVYLDMVERMLAAKP